MNKRLLLAVALLMVVSLACGGSSAPEPVVSVPVIEEIIKEVEPSISNTESIENYGVLQITKAQMCGDAMTHISEISDFGSEEMQTAIDDFDFYCTMFWIEEPPVGFEEINDLMLSVDENYTMAAEMIRRGIELEDVGLLDMGTEYLLTGTEIMNEATVLLDSMGQ